MGKAKGNSQRGELNVPKKRNLGDRLLETEHQGILTLVDGKVVVDAKKLEKTITSYKKSSAKWKHPLTEACHIYYVHMRKKYGNTRPCANDTADKFLINRGTLSSWVSKYKWNDEVNEGKTIVKVEPMKAIKEKINYAPKSDFRKNNAYLCFGLTDEQVALVEEESKRLRAGLDYFHDIIDNITTRIVMYKQYLEDYNKLADDDDLVIDEITETTGAEEDVTEVKRKKVLTYKMSIQREITKCENMKSDILERLNRIKTDQQKLILEREKFELEKTLKLGDDNEEDPLASLSKILAESRKVDPKHITFSNVTEIQIGNSTILEI